MTGDSPRAAPPWYLAGVSPTAPLALVREAFGTAGEKRFLLARALYRAALGPHWGHLVLAFAYMKRLDDLVDEDPEPARALELLREHRRFIASVYAGATPAGDPVAPARFAWPFLAWDRDRGAALRAPLERLLRTMEFDTLRRGRVLDAAALDTYVLEVGASVTDLLGPLLMPGDALPADFVTAASRAYLGADAVIDVRHDLALGLVNIPREDLARHALDPEPSHPRLAGWIAERAPLLATEFDRALAGGRRLDGWSARVLAQLYLATKRRHLARFLARERGAGSGQAAAA